MFNNQSSARYTIPFNVSLEDEQCIVCGKPTTFCCSRCRRVYYCSQTCQRTDWRSHKLTCSEAEGTPVPSPRAPLASAEGLPEPTFTGLLDTVAAFDRASELLKQGLMSRFGSIVGAYEWFDVQMEGNISFAEFEKSLMTVGVVNTVIVREMFTVLDRGGSGKISLSEFLSDAVKKLHPRGLDISLGQQHPDVEREEGTNKGKVCAPTDPGKLPPGRRALRSASILAFRNGRYDDAIVSSLQALGITSPSVKAYSTIQRHPDNLVELLLIARAMVLTNQVSKGEPLLDLISSILLPVSDTFPAHVTATLLCAAADICDQYQRKEMAQKFYQEYVDLVKDVFGSESLVLGDALTIAAGFFLKHSELQKAMDLAILAKEIREKNLTAPHARLADALSNFATVLKLNKEEIRAIPIFKEAAEQRLALFGPNSLQVADSFFALGSCFLALCKKKPQIFEENENMEQGHKYLSGCHSIRLKLLGPSHVDSLAAADALRQLNNVRNPIIEKRRKTISEIMVSSPHETSMSSELSVPQEPEAPVFHEMAEHDPIGRPRLSKSFAFEHNEASENASIKSFIDSIKEEETHVIKNNLALVSETEMESPKSVVSDAASQKSKGSFFANLFHKRSQDEDLIPNSPLAAEEANRKELEKVVENTKFPISPFSESFSQLEPCAVLKNLLNLEPNLIHSLNFLINDSFPFRAPNWLTMAMRGVYFRRALAEETEPESKGTKIQTFLTDLKAQEKNLKLIFKLLNSINKTISAQTGNRKTTELNLNTFTVFINSRTQNVALLDYFVETLQKQNPGVVEQIIPGLQSIEEVHDVDFAAYAVHLGFVTKSLLQIEKGLVANKRDTAGTSVESLTVIAVLKMKSEIKQVRMQLEERTKILTIGTHLLLELFKAKGPVDPAVDCLDELYAQISKILLGGDSELGSENEHDDELEDVDQ